MREIKFRVWEGKDMRVIDWNNNNLHMGRINVAILSDAIREKPKHVMQYTGLKDKNGKEIYEGDIVKFGAKNNDEIIGWGEVYWKDNGWVHGFQEWFYNNDIEKWEPDYGMWRPPKALWGLSNVWFEVVGNKFENPELLEQ